MNRFVLARKRSAAAASRLAERKKSNHLADYVISRVLVGPVDDASFLLVCQHGIASGVTIKGLSKLVIGDGRAIQQDQCPLDFPNVRSRRVLRFTP